MWSGDRLALSFGGLFEYLDYVAVRVEEGRYPTSPVLLFRRAYELDSPTGKFLVQGVYVVHVEVDHDAMGVPGLAAHVVVAADGEPQSAPLERDEVGALGVRLPFPALRSRTP